MLDSKQTLSVSAREFGFNYQGLTGAQERTRTSTSIQTLAPEASASTNSATWAGVVSRAFKPRRWGCQMDSLASAAAFFLVDGFMDGARMISMATASFEKLRNL